MANENPHPGKPADPGKPDPEPIPYDGGSGDPPPPPKKPPQPE